MIWEKRFNVFHTDVPAHRVGWASPSVDPATGNIYLFGVDGHVHALDPTGKLLWQRQLTEEFGEISTHGGRTVSPVIEGDLVIVSTLTSGWGDQARGSNRYFAFDKRDGSVVWISSPQPKHYDTNYSTPTVRRRRTAGDSWSWAAATAPSTGSRPPPGARSGTSSSASARS